MVHGGRVYPEPRPASVKTASVLRLAIGIVIAVALTWMVTRAFKF
jgi:hypothetical protein